MNKGTERRLRLDPDTDQGRKVYDAQKRYQVAKEARKQKKATG